MVSCLCLWFSCLETKTARSMQADFEKRYEIVKNLPSYRKNAAVTVGEASQTAVLRFHLHTILTIPILTWVNYRYNRRTVPVTDIPVPNI